MSRYPSHLSPDITPTSSPSKLSKSQRSRQRREPSGVFSLFSPPQIQQFREAFSLIDHDGDGVVTEQDLKHIFTSMGKPLRSNELDELLQDRPGNRRGSGSHSRIPSLEEPTNDRGITFPMFLTMMGEHLYDFDTEQELLEAFECFDENDTGMVKSDEMRKWLADVGEKMSQAEIDKLLQGSTFTDRQGNFNYKEWVKVLRINADSETTDD